eukprot:5701362-Alexandrium_andersonii.AAC.1
MPALRHSALTHWRISNAGARNPMPELPRAGAPQYRARACNPPPELCSPMPELRSPTRAPWGLQS